MSPRSPRPIDQLLERLENVRQLGDGRYSASAPTRRDRNPSLSIRELPDGRVLVHDHGGASPDDILAAVGLTLADLYPARNQSPQQRRDYRSFKGAVEALAAIDREALLVAVVAADIHAHRVIDDATWRRLQLAVSRIGAARAACS